jgi:hypothetical protein
MEPTRFSTRGLTPIDIRAVKAASTALSWEVEIARSAEREAFALIIPATCDDLVFALTNEQGEYILTKYRHYPEPPNEVVRGSLEAALAALP